MPPSPTSPPLPCVVRPPSSSTSLPSPHAVRRRTEAATKFVGLPCVLRRQTELRRPQSTHTAGQQVEKARQLSPLGWNAMV
ncbi:hypothetical protein Droror1_Dr00025162 [Drosera rotundifolia]